MTSENQKMAVKRWKENHPDRVKAHKKTAWARLIKRDPTFGSRRWKKFKEQHNARLLRYKTENIKFLCSLKGIDYPRCEVCGYEKNFAAIDGHHNHPSQKERARDTLGNWLRYSPLKFREKIKNINLILLCKNCHTELHVLGQLAGIVAQ